MHARADVAHHVKDRRALTDEFRLQGGERDHRDRDPHHADAESLQRHRPEHVRGAQIHVELCELPAGDRLQEKAEPDHETRIEAARPDHQREGDEGSRAARAEHEADHRVGIAAHPLEHRREQRHRGEVEHPEHGHQDDADYEVAVA